MQSVVNSVREKIKKKSKYWDEALKPLEIIAAVAAGLCISSLIAWLFYDHIAAVVLLSPFSFISIIVWRKYKATKRRDCFILQYKDFLYYLSVALSAGKSLEYAFKDAEKSLLTQYSIVDKSDLIVELNHIIERVHLRVPIELLLDELATRTELTDLKSFAEVISICRKSGGNLVEVVQSAIRILREKIATCNEIETNLLAKKLEQRILGVAPLFIILMIRATSGEFIAPMYESLAGRTIMTIALVLICFGFWLGAQMMKIKL